MSQLIKFKRGLKANLPTSAAVGEPLFATDTGELFVGTGTGIVAVVGEDKNVTVGANGTKDHLNENYFEQDGTNHIRIKQGSLLVGVNADKIDGKDVDDSAVDTSNLWTAGKIVSYVQQFSNGLDWQNSVLTYATAPVTPVAGDRYLVAAVATGAFAGKEGKIAEYNGTTWSFVTPNSGFAVYVEDEGKQYTFNGTAWVNFGSTTNHNATSGLQGGTTNEYYHLTNDELNGLTTGGVTTLHSHDTDDLEEGSANLFFTVARAKDAVGGVLDATNSIAFTYAGGRITADLQKQNTNSISLLIDASGLKADLQKSNTNSVALTVDTNGLSAAVRTQTSDTVTLSVDASGVKADLKKQATDSIALTSDASGLKANLNSQSTTSVTLAVDASGLKADVKVDDVTIKIDETNGLYIELVDGGSF